MAHQSYLQLAAEIGVPGLLAFLALLSATAWALVRAGPCSTEEAWLLPAIGASGATIAAHNLIDYSWLVYGTAVPFWTIVGIAWALSRRREPRAVRESGRMPRRVAAGALIAVLRAMRHVRTRPPSALGRRPVAFRPAPC
jgi:hypothetical protein